MAEGPLDEIQWSAPHIIRDMLHGSLVTDNVLHYFSHSPFYDETSNNNMIVSQAMYNPQFMMAIQTRESFERVLRDMNGIQFIVAQEPVRDEKTKLAHPIWVIRKQHRTSEGEITPISNYFVVGEHVYMAPTVGNILSSRLLSTVTSLTSLLSTISPLPTFTPSLGHTYIPPESKPFNNPSIQTTQASGASTPLPSQPNSQQPSQSLRLKSATNSFHSNASTAITTIPSPKANAILTESLNLSLQYSTEYMDINPLAGEPGAFILQKAPALPSSKLKFGTGINPFSSSGKEKVVPPPLTTTDLSTKKGVGGEKSPITPGLTPGGGKKRKKKNKGLIAIATANATAAKTATEKAAQATGGTDVTGGDGTVVKGVGVAKGVRASPLKNVAGNTSPKKTSPKKGSPLKA